MSLLIYLLIVSCWCFSDAAISDKRKCIDEKCSVPISKAKTLLRYSASDPEVLSVGSNEEVTVYSKEAGNNLELWGIEVNGKRGYLSKQFLKEFKTLSDQKPNILVDTESEYARKVPLNSPEALVIDGTTLYEDIVPSSTQQQVPPSTEVPVKEETPKDEHLSSTTNSDVIKEKETVNPHEDDEGDDEEEDEDDDIDIETEDEEEDFDEDEEDEKNKVAAELLQDEKKLTADSLDTVAQTITVGTDKEVNNLNLTSELPLIDNQEEFVSTDKQIPIAENGIDLDSGIPPIGKVTDDVSIPKQKTLEVAGQPGILLESQKVPKPTPLPLFFHTVPSASSGDIPVVPASSGISQSDSSETVASGTENFGSSQIPPIIENNDEQKVLTEANQENINKDNVKELWVPHEGIPEVPELYQKSSSSMNSFPSSEDSTSTIKPSFSEENTETKSTQTEGFNDFTYNLTLDDTLKQSNIVSDTEKTVDTVSNCDSGLCQADVPIQTQEESIKTSFEVVTEPNPKYVNEERRLEEIQIIPNINWKEEEISITGLENSTEEKASVEIPPVTEEIWVEDHPLSGNQVTEEITTEMPVIETVTEHNSESYEPTESVEQNSRGWIDALLGLFGSATREEPVYSDDMPKYVENNDDVLLSHYASHASCSVDDAHCHPTDQSKAAMLHEGVSSSTRGLFDFLELNDTILIVAISGACVVLFLWGYMLIEKMRKEGPLVGKINQLEQQLLILAKENEVLATKLEDSRNQTQEINENVSSELVLELQKELEDASSARNVLEEQIQSLEKELENSTEVGLELNKMLSEVLSSQNGSDTVMANIEQLQKQLIEQQGTINSVNTKLNEKDTENHELQLELEINNKKVIDLQAELEKMMINLLKAEEEKEAVVSKSELEVADLRTQLAKVKAGSGVEMSKVTKDLAEVKSQLTEVQRKFELKSKEYNLLRETLSDSDANNTVVDQSALRAELLQLAQDNKTLSERLAQDKAVIKNFEEQHGAITNENRQLVKRYEDADRKKLEALTKLEVLSTYFKEREAQLQSELGKHEAMWTEKQGEATSTSERIKFMQTEIQNFKAQVASLQQEIVSQEVDLKSQISVLEKKAHENWVAARQAERRIEDSRQEAAQLRNRLTLRERSLNEDKSQNRNGILSPLESNGVDHINDTASPPLLYGTRDHLTTSPPLLPGLPPGFPLPPPPTGVGVPPFMPHALPPGMPFMPPPPSMFPGDHRPPPLGRMSSPPLNSRYTPDSRAFSPYDRHSPSPTDDDYYDRDSYYNTRSSSKRGNGRRSGYSSASNSNESLDKLDRSHSKV